MATHSSLLPQRILWTEEAGGLLSTGRTESDTTEVTQHACMHWRRKWQPSPVFLPGEFRGQRRLVGYSPWGLTESDTTKATQQQQQQAFNTCYHDLVKITIYKELCSVFLVTKDDDLYIKGIANTHRYLSLLASLTGKQFPRCLIKFGHFCLIVLIIPS